MATNLTKNLATPTALSKNSSTGTNQRPYIYAWAYNESGMTYNDTTDPLNNQVVYYESAGAYTATNLTKNNA